MSFSPRVMKNALNVSTICAVLLVTALYLLFIHSNYFFLISLLAILAISLGMARLIDSAGQGQPMKKTAMSAIINAVVIIAAISILLFSYIYVFNYSLFGTIVIFIAILIIRMVARKKRLSG